MKEKFIKKDVTSTLKLDNLFTIYSFLFSPLNIQYYKDHPECHEYPYLTAWRAITHYYENASSIPQYSTDWEEYICDIKSMRSSLRGAYPYRGTIEDCRDILDRHGHDGTGFKSMLNHFLMENQTVFGDYRIILDCSFWEKKSEIQGPWSGRCLPLSTTTWSCESDNHTDRDWLEVQTTQSDRTSLSCPEWCNLGMETLRLIEWENAWFHPIQSIPLQITLIPHKCIHDTAYRSLVQRTHSYCIGINESIAIPKSSESILKYGNNLLIDCWIAAENAQESDLFSLTSRRSERNQLFGERIKYVKRSELLLNHAKNVFAMFVEDQKSSLDWATSSGSKLLNTSDKRDIITKKKEKWNWLSHPDERSWKYSTNRTVPNDYIQETKFCRSEIE